MFEKKKNRFPDYLLNNFFTQPINNFLELQLYIINSLDILNTNKFIILTQEIVDFQ